MKKNSVMSLAIFVLLLAGVSLPQGSNAQRYDGSNMRNRDHDRIVQDSRTAKKDFISEDDKMRDLFNNSYGYVIFPNVGKGAFGVGAAAGRGIVYERGMMIGTASMQQLNVGFQIGGKSYREVIFFENKRALDKFKDNRFELGAQASAVTLDRGVSTNASYRRGVMVFTQAKTGLMYDASVGGQRFSYAAL